jgi:hypothetical protein
MGPLIAQCPKTCAPINTGLSTDYKTLAKSWDNTIRIRCPHCNEDHDIKVRDAFVRGEVSSLKVRGELDHA